MKKLSELSIADLAALDMLIYNSLNNMNLTMEEYNEALHRQELLKAEIGKRLAEIDFNS